MGYSGLGTLLVPGRSGDSVGRTRGMAEEQWGGTEAAWGLQGAEGMGKADRRAGRMAG